MAVRHRLLSAAAALAVLGHLGCGRQPVPAPPAREFRVRLLISEQASGRWQRQAVQGLERIAGELGAAVDRRPVADGTLTRDLVADTTGRASDLVFCVGPDFANAVFTEAASFPSTRFVLVPGRGHSANVAGIEFLPAGAGYVAGVVAARLRSADSIGILRGAGGAWLEELASGFVAGYRSLRREAGVVVVDSRDGPWELVAAGVEVALYATDEPNGEAMAAAHDAGLLLVASDSALLDQDPDVIAAAVQVDLAEAMLRLAREAAAGSFTGGEYAFDLGSGVLDVRLNPTLPGNQLPSLQDALETARSEVTAGIVEMEELGI